MTLSIVSGPVPQAITSSPPQSSGSGTPVAKSGNESPPTQSSAIGQKQLADAVAQVNAFTQPIAKDLQFAIDKGSGKVVVKVVDAATNQVLTQIPSEEMLEIAKAVGKLQGLLVKNTA
jgi:flagellar protein FlaG